MELSKDDMIYYLGWYNFFNWQTDEVRIKKIDVLTTMLPAMIEKFYKMGGDITEIKLLIEELEKGKVRYEIKKKNNLNPAFSVLENP